MQLAPAHRENKKKMEEFIYVLLVFLSSISVSQLPELYWFYSIFIIGILILTYYLINKRKNIKQIIWKKEFRIAAFFIITELCVVIYSFIIMVFAPDRYLMAGSFSRMIGIFVYLTIIIFEAFCIVDFFGKENAVKLTLIGILLNYVLSIIISLFGCKFNISIILDYIMGIDVKGNNIVLEAHELVPCFASGIIFLILNKSILKKERKTFILLLSLFTLLCGKRIITFSLLVILFLYFVYTKFKYHLNRFIFPAVSVLEVLAGYFYIFIIKSGVFYQLINFFGINTMQRDTLYRAMNPYYSFSTFFLGKGSGFTSKWLDNNWMNIEIYGATSSLGLHNDFLRHYIELGFFGFFFYLVSLLLLIPSKVKQYFGRSSTERYVFLFAFQLICWTVDQISVYYIFQLVFFIYLFSSMRRD